MNLTVLTPLGIVLQTKVQKVIVETLNGYHTFLPKHIDFVSALGPNIVAYWNDDNSAKYVACHNGIVVKKASQITISVQNALLGNDLEELESIVSREYRQNEEQRKELNTAVARLELGIMRGFDRIKGDVS